MPLHPVAYDALTIDDDASFAHIGLYARLKRLLRRSGQRFLIPDAGATASWDRALFLNLTYWGGGESADVLCDEHIPADVVAHVAFHRAVGVQLAKVGAPSAEGVLFSESIASAFDLYLLGRLLHNAPECDFILSQVPIMSEAAEDAGLSSAALAELLQSVAEEPERAFEDMRALLFDAATALYACRGAAEAQVVLEGFGGHRFEPLLHHYQLSNWILYARAYTTSEASAGDSVRRLDTALRGAPSAIDWIDEHWIGD